MSHHAILCLGLTSPEAIEVASSTKTEGAAEQRSNALHSTTQEQQETTLLQKMTTHHLPTNRGPSVPMPALSTTNEGNMCSSMVDVM